MDENLKEILLKVRDLYMKYGVKSITMDDVATHLGISKKTIYQYVKDKNELVGLVVDMQMEEVQCQHYSVREKGFNAIEELLMVSKMLNKLLKQINPATEYDLKKYYPNHYNRLISRRRQHMYEQIMRNIRTGKAEGLYRQELNDEVIAKLQLSRTEFVVQSDIFSVEEFTSPKFFQEIFEYHIRGIANKKGIEFLEKKLRDFDIEDFNEMNPNKPN
jgi:AcrR family transcriptional regulator